MAACGAERGCGCNTPWDECDCTSSRVRDGCHSNTGTEQVGPGYSPVTRGKIVGRIAYLMAGAAFLGLTLYNVYRVGYNACEQKWELRYNNEIVPTEKAADDTRATAPGQGRLHAHSGGARTHFRVRRRCADEQLCTVCERVDSLDRRRAVCGCGSVKLDFDDEHARGGDTAGADREE